MWSDWGKDTCRVLVGNLNERGRFVDLGVDGDIVLKLILEK
jgi:hypothetical protein